LVQKFILGTKRTIKIKSGLNLKGFNFIGTKNIFNPLIYYK